MTTVNDRTTLDPISLEVLRSRLEAIAEDAATTIQRTAVSPIITESHDFGVTLLDGDGNLLAGGGWVAMHWSATTRSIRATIERHGDTIAPGDVFLANDPYNGGGLHANDVIIEQPIFYGDERVAWIALSAHMMDIGGMVIGSFAPAATECYQEAFRVPPVRLLRQGQECSDIWDILRVNVRMAPLIEMDIRGCIAGGHVAAEKVEELVDAMGLDFFRRGGKALQDLSERELRARIEAMADGTYRVVTWNEWEDELSVIPCTLTIDGDHMLFDFEGASPQVPHFVNSQPYIIKATMMMNFAPVVVPDLPYTEGLLVPIELHCPEGSIVHGVAPAPMNDGHVHVAQAASEAMMECVRMALWATSPQLEASRRVYGWSGAAAMGVTTWAGVDVDGGPATWAFIDGAAVGSSAAGDRDGLDFASLIVGFGSPAASADIEVLESWYPMLVTERRVRPGLNGPGEHRSGGGAQVAFRPHGADVLEGQMLGIREYLPLEGAAGGFPGATCLFLRHRADGEVERISNKAADVVLRAGEHFEFRSASGGGVGDPLARDPEAVADDVSTGLITGDDAAAVYGVLFQGDGVVDVAGTRAARAEILRDRLRRATPPLRPVADDATAGAEGHPALPLYPGIVRRGPVAYVEASGAPLALAPDHWTDGCAVLEERRPGPGPEITIRAYLDPTTGTSLHVEAVPAGEPRSFEVSPRDWIEAGDAAH